MEILLTAFAFLLYGKSVYKSFADRLPINGTEQVLDFGCGMGTVAYYVAKRLPRGQLICLDISERWLKYCRKTMQRYTNVSFLQSDVLLSESYDIVYCHFVLHGISVSDLKSIIPDLVKSLKRDGKLVFREPLKEEEKLVVIKGLIKQSGLSLIDSRITDVPLMGNVLESVYVKKIMEV